MGQWLRALIVAILASAAGVAVNIATSSTRSFWAWVAVLVLTLLSACASFWAQRSVPHSPDSATASLPPSAQPFIVGDLPEGTKAETDEESASNCSTTYETNPTIVGLPPDVPGFCGRMAEQRLIIDTLHASHDGSGCVLITGVPGVGKTSLTLHVVHSMLREHKFAGGALFVNMHGYGGFGPSRSAVTANSALGKFLRALGVEGQRIPPSVDERSAMFRALLQTWGRAGNTLLIVVDNASDARQVQPLLPSLSETRFGHRVLITSRNSLAGLYGVRIIELDLLDDQSAKQLIINDVRAAVPTDSRVSDEHKVDDLIRLCDRLPLALRVVSAMLATEPELPLDAVIGELSQKSSRLDSLDQAGNNAGLAVRSAFQLSYRALEPGQRLHFALLACCPGSSISTETAAIIADENVDAVQASLRELRRSHLIQPAFEYGFWRMHDLAKLFAAEVLSKDYPTSIREEAIARMLADYIRKAKLASRQLNPRVDPQERASIEFPTRRAATEWFAQEKENLVASVSMAVDQGENLAACDLAEALTGYFDLRQLWEEWVETHEAALVSARRLKDRLLEARILNHLGIAWNGLRKYDTALAHYLDASRIRHAEGDQNAEGRTLNNMGMVYAAQAKFDRALEFYERALNILETVGDRFGQSQVLRNIGVAYLTMGTYSDAAIALLRALKIVRNIGDEYGEGIVLARLGDVQREMRDLPGGIRYYEQSIEARKRSLDLHGQASTLTDLGKISAEQGDRSRAESYQIEAVALFRQLDDLERLAEALLGLGEIYLENSDVSNAQLSLQEAVSLFRRAGDGRGEATALISLGDAYNFENKLNEARASWRNALSILTELGEVDEASKVRSRIEQDI